MIADEGGLVRDGVDPVDPRTPIGRVERPCADEGDERRTVSPGVEERHRRMQESDGVVQPHGHRRARHLDEAVRHGDSGLFVEREDRLGSAPCRMDDRVVESSQCRTRVEREMRTAVARQRIKDQIGGVPGPGARDFPARGVHGVPVSRVLAAHLNRKFTALVRVNESSSSIPCSSPLPESFQPPNGTAG